MAEVEVATFEQIATLLSQLSNNYSNLAVNYYDIFYNPIPQDVTIQLYDDTGVLKDYVIPNRAKDFRFVLNGSGNPEGAISAKVGTTYQDILNGRFYIKQLGEDNKGWVEVASRDDFIKGEGSPEGIEIKPRGTLYVDTLEGSLYIKTTTTGSSGWVELPKSGDFVDQDLSNITPEGESRFANPALSNLNPLGESRFANPALSNLNNIGKNVINSKENLSNKTGAISSSSTNIQYPTARAVYDVTHRLDNIKENSSNKVNKIDSSSTDIQYPTAKAVYDATHKLSGDKASINLDNLTEVGSKRFTSTVSLDSTGAHKKDEIVFVNALNSQESVKPYQKPGTQIMYSAPVYPSIPYNNQVHGVDHTFEVGGLVISCNACDVTLFAGEVKPLVFKAFVGVLPVSMGTKVHTSADCFFAEMK